MFLPALAGLGYGSNKVISVGLDVNREFGDRLDIESSYFLFNLRRAEDHSTLRQQVLDSQVAANTVGHSNTTSDNLQHRISIYAKSKLREGQDIRVRARVAHGTISQRILSDQVATDSTRRSTAHSFTEDDKDGRTWNGAASVTWRQRLSQSGWSLVGTGSVTEKDNRTNSMLRSAFSLATLGDLVTREELRQLQNEDANELVSAQSLSVIRPLGRGRDIEVFVRRRATSRDQSKLFYDVIDQGTVLNQKLSNRCDQLNPSYSTGVRLSANPLEGMWISGGITLRYPRVQGKSGSDGAEVEQGYTHLLPHLRYQHPLSMGSRLQIRYQSTAHLPTVAQLKPFVDNNDPLRVIVGNPFLKPSNVHQVKGSVMFMDPISFLRAGEKLTYLTGWSVVNFA